MYHSPALLEESVEGLAVRANGTYVDVTFGGGGHSKEILKQLGEEGRLFAFDQDPDARNNAIEDKRFVFIQQNFSFLKNYLRMYSALPVDGVLADLGVSFHQFDQAERGFSFRFDGPLDMRMDKARNLTAAKILNSYASDDLLRVFKTYGELRNAKLVVQKILNYRSEKRYSKTSQLKETLAGMVPEKHQHKFLAQVFQALRIEVNDELKVIEDLLSQAEEVLAEGGRLAVITYHSLEDRLVKNYFKSGNVEGRIEKDFFGNIKRGLRPVNRKPIIPGGMEVNQNNRARSAKLRVAEKINE